MSLVTLFLHLLMLKIKSKRLQTSVFEDADEIATAAPQKGFWSAHVADAGGLPIVLYKFSRLLGVVALLGLVINSTIYYGPDLGRWVVLSVVVSASGLSLLVSNIE